MKHGYAPESTMSVGLAIQRCAQSQLDSRRSAYASALMAMAMVAGRKAEAA